MERIKIRIIQEIPKKSREPHSVKFLFTKNIFFGILIGLICAGIFSSIFLAVAAWDGNPYGPGTTTNPECGPTDPHCTVSPSANYSFGANNFSGSGNFVTTGTGSFGSINLTTTSLTVGNGGTGISSTTPYALLTGGTTAGGALQQVLGLGNAGQVLTSGGPGILPTWSSAGSSMVYPGAGIAVSTSTGWDTSLSAVNLSSLAGLATTVGLVKQTSANVFGIDATSYVPTSTTVNGHALSGNISVTATDVGLGNVTNESKATMFASPTFTGTVSGVTATMVGLNNLTNDKQIKGLSTGTTTGHLVTWGADGYTVTDGGVVPAGMAWPSGSGIAIVSSGSWGTTITDNSTNWNAAASHKTTEDAINGLVFVNGAGSYSAKSIGTDVQAYNANLSSIAGLVNSAGWLHNNGSGTFAYSTPIASDVGLGNVTNESKATMFTSPTFTGTVSGVTATMVGLSNVTNDAQIKASIGTAKGDLITFSGASTPVHIVAGSTAGNLRTDGLGNWSVDTSTYLTTAGTAADSSKLNGQSAGYYQTALGTTNLLALNSGGTAANLTAVNGGIVYSGASALGISAAGSAGQILQSNGAASPVWSTATYPATAGTSGTLLTSNGTNITNTTATYPTTAGTTSTLLRSNGTNIVNTANLTFDETSLNVAGSGASQILSSAAPLILGETAGTNTNNEQLKFDFDTAIANKVAVTSDTGANLIDFGTINLNSGGYIAGNIVTSVVSGVPATTPADGALIVDSADGRLYVRYGSAWKYTALNSSFQIPTDETTDPISGDQMKEGDVVMGMIDSTMSDNALHGVWVKWDSVKAQLLAEARGELAQDGSSGNGTVSGVQTTTLLDRVTNVLTTLGISIKDGVTNINQLAVQKSTTDVARINKMEMVDSDTGEIYCTWIKDGEWVKVKGECGSLDVANASVQPSAQEETAQQMQNVVQQVQQVVQQSQQAITQSANDAVSQVQQAAQQAQTQTAEPATTPSDQTTPAPAEQIPAPAETSAPAEQPAAPAEQTPAPAETPAPAGNSANSTGDLVQSAASDLLKGVWNFIKWISGASVKEVAKAIPETVKSGSAGLSSFAKENIGADLQQTFLQLKELGILIISPINRLIGK